MTIEEQVSYLQLKFPQFDKTVIHDTDNHGNNFCEAIMPNKSQPNLPLTVCVTERGCSISVGQVENVTGSTSMTAEQTCSAIRDILDDKIIFALGYREGDDTGFGSPYFSRIFALTGKDDDMSEDYEYFIKKISSPLSKFARMLSTLKGRFVIFNFSGSINQELTR